MTITSERPKEVKAETAVCPHCHGEAFRVGSSASSWKCQNCGKQFERAGADSRGYFPGVRRE
jgi:transposase-like protein